MLHSSPFPTYIHAFNCFCLQNLFQSLLQAEFIFQAPNHVVCPSISGPCDHGGWHLFCPQQGYIRVGRTPFWAVGLGIKRGDQTSWRLTSEAQLRGVSGRLDSTDCWKQAHRPQMWNQDTSLRGSLRGTVKSLPLLSGNWTEQVWLNEPTVPIAAERKTNLVGLKAVCLIWPASFKENS